jgi:hypothetical protein
MTQIYLAGSGMSSALSYGFQNAGTICTYQIIIKKSHRTLHNTLNYNFSLFSFCSLWTRLKPISVNYLYQCASNGSVSLFQWVNHFPLWYSARPYSLPNKYFPPHFHISPCFEILFKTRNMLEGDVFLRYWMTFQLHKLYRDEQDGILHEWWTDSNLERSGLCIFADVAPTFGWKVSNTTINIVPYGRYLGSGSNGVRIVVKRITATQTCSIYDKNASHFPNLAPTHLCRSWRLTSNYGPYFGLVI